MSIDKLNIRFNEPIYDQENIEKLKDKVNEVIDNFDGTLDVKNIEASGKITGNEIVENMSGYSFIKGAEVSGLTRDYIYVSAVKNGNKLTFVIACNITRTDTLATGVTLGSFKIPANITSKIYPSQIGSYYYVSVDTINVWASDSISKSIQIYSLKDTSNNKIDTGMNVSPLNNLTLNTTYYARWEITILLSDNLID